GQKYILFVDIFYLIVFLSTIIIGFFKNDKSFKGYKRVWNCDGYQDDFPIKCGMPITLINIGVYGLFILAYFNLAFLVTEGVGFTGPTVGVTIAAITFSASGQTPKNVWPIIVGYTIISLLTIGVCAITQLSPVWTLTTQSYINGIAFATGLCPFTGKYGRKYGIIAGAIHAILCTSTSAMHGGFVLYNGGLTSGLTALILLPILDFYKVKPKEIQD
ncbi:MAG: DUF1576 domain-containing protein, partial [Clostridia bacterium]|nr:DUF1576 domain-containing protein [Clostridia bacterium]